jgi:hypothetical protein
MATVADIQTALGVTPDGIWGSRSQAALDALIHGSDGKHVGKASSFADPADVAAFKRCKDRGNSDQECFKVGDNGIGCWDDDVSEGTGTSCAVPPDDMIARWGSVDSAKHRPVEITANGKTIIAVLKDRMPWKKNITNGAVIDLNPDSCRELGVEPPVMINCEWRWA